MYANGTPETYVLHSKREIFFEPPLKSLDEAVERIEALARKAALIRPEEGQSIITIEEYRLPRGLANYIVIGWSVLMLIGIFARNVLLPENAYYEDLGLGRNPTVAKWSWRVLTFFSIGTLIVHIVEAGVILAPKLHKYNVPLGSVLWSKWILGHIAGGMTSTWAFDELVSEEEKRYLGGVKKDR
ncbi:hypothetical protein K432DRAFT_305321 [Lepidopterella palustris CBS 459.81]|uniref:DUF2470 domain-containing protein n=1 Tax=Lepidopterella palustris CBS 459.81 TaxID=1314670 RepID=A0A8E2JBZ0_9PEZI|nr:hypothetical protein K432DRAFT_305321 [Lepidopterella palustris CBS 459.81]